MLYNTQEGCRLVTMISMTWLPTHAYGRGLVLPGFINETKPSQGQQAR